MSLKKQMGLNKRLFCSNRDLGTRPGNAVPVVDAPWLGVWSRRRRAATRCDASDWRIPAAFIFAMATLLGDTVCRLHSCLNGIVTSQILFVRHHFLAKWTSTDRRRANDARSRRLEHRRQSPSDIPKVCDVHGPGRDASFVEFRWHPVKVSCFFASFRSREPSARTIPWSPRRHAPASPPSRCSRSAHVLTVVHLKWECHIVGRATIPQRRSRLRHIMRFDALG